MSSSIGTLTVSIESKELPQLSSNVQQLFSSIGGLRDSGGVVTDLVAAVNVPKGSSELPELVRNVHLLIKTVEELEE